MHHNFFTLNTYLMKVILESLKISALTNMEAGQLINRHVSDLATIDSSIATDVPYNNYLQEIGHKMELYRNALLQIQKSDETEKILLADAARDKAIIAFSLALKLHGVSDDPAEVEASRCLGILFDKYKNLGRLNYEAETLGIDKLTDELNSPDYSDKINYLNMGKYVARMTNANDLFKNLFGERMVTSANTESYNMKILRSELQYLYNDFTNYVLAMAKVSENTLFQAALSLLNTARKYYADLLAKRTVSKTGSDKPSVN